MYVFEKTAEAITAFVADPEKLSRFFLRRRPRTEDVLDIIWTADDSLGQDTRKGVTAHGLYRRPASRRTRFLGHVWPTETQMQSTTFSSPDDDCVIIEWTILPSARPAPDIGCSTLEQTLRSFLDDGAVVAWSASKERSDIHPSSLIRTRCGERRQRQKSPL